MNTPAVIRLHIGLYQMEGLRLKEPRRLTVRERAIPGMAEFIRWHERGTGFLAGAAFYRNRGDAPMAALMLQQACEHFYLCVLRSISLHAPRTHALDELREAAEVLNPHLCSAWPRDGRFERRAFGCIRRAYVEARYGQSYRISNKELAWAFARAKILQEPTHTNAKVRDLNDAARAAMRSAGELGEERHIKTERGDRQFASGDRILFLRNERSLEVKNGTLESKPNQPLENLGAR